jgi:hypothetical protein
LEYLDSESKKENDFLKRGHKLYFLNQKLFEKHFWIKEHIKKLENFGNLRISLEDWKSMKRMEKIF